MVWAKAGSETAPGPRKGQPRSFHIKRDLLDLARERKRQLVSEVHRRADVHADVHALAERDLQWDRPGQLPFGHLGAVSRERHGGGLAALAGLALVGEIDDEFDLALGQGVL